MTITQCGKDIPPEKLALHQARCSRCGGKPPHPPGSRHLPDYFSSQEAVDIIATADAWHWKVLFWVLWETGARIGEALRLKRKDFLPGQHLLGIETEKRADHYYGLLPVSSDLCDELAGYIGALPARQQFLFPYTVDGATKALKRTAVRTGITRPIRTHMWRHALGKRLARELQLPELDALNIIRQQLRHKGWRSVRVYVEVTPRDAAEQVRRVLEA